MLPNVQDIFQGLVNHDVTVHFIGTTVAQAPRTYKLITFDEDWIVLQDRTAGGSYAFLPATAGNYWLQYQGPIEGLKAA